MKAQGQVPPQSKRRKPTTSMSKMSGDNLSLLRSSMRQAEMSPRVQSFNLATRVEMMRKINWCFREQNLTVDKMNKAQFQTYKDLKRVHQDKRRMMRASWQYKQEEARTQIERDARDRKVQQILDNYDSKSREILGELLKTKLQKRKLNSTASDGADSEEINDDQTGVNNVDSDILKINDDCDTQGKDDYVDKVHNKRKNSDIKTEQANSGGGSVETLTEKNLRNHDQIMKDKLTSKQHDENQTRPTMVRESSKVLEVSKNDLGDPKTRHRVKQTDNADESIKSDAKKVEFEPEIIDLVIEKISEVNNPVYDNEVATVTVLPAIGETDLPDSLQIECKIEENDTPHSQNTEPSSSKEKNMTMLEFMRKKAKQTERMKKRILEEPYTAYTRDRRGKIVPLEVPPKPFDSNVPSTRAIYLRDKALERQIEINQENDSRIQKFFEKMEREEKEKVRKENLAVKRRMSEINRAARAKKREAAERRLPPMTMTAFLQKYPEEWDLNGLDPNSVEILKRCRYIRFKDGTIKEIDTDLRTALAEIRKPQDTKT